MSDLASLITAVASLITALGGIAGLVINTRQQRRDAASPVDELQDRRLRELEEAVRDTDDTTGGEP